MKFTCHGMRQARIPSGLHGRLLLPCLLGMGSWSAASATTVTSIDAASPVEVVITGATQKTSRYAERNSGSATRLDLSLRETPQSVSVLTRERLDDFHLSNVNEALAGTTGVTVEKVESDRIYYTARGYDITNFQYDGLGIPFVFGNVYGDLDTALYERIDIVRGANGLMSPTGNPSATVNFIRKRPTNALRASAALTLGSWNTRRIDADISSSLNDSNTVAGRVVLAHQEGDSYLSRYQPSKDVAYGVLEFRPDAQNRISIGHVYQRSTGKGGMWGALPLYFSDGSPVNFDVSASTSAGWSRWATDTQQTFIDYTHDFSGDWQTRFAYSDNTVSTDGRLLYVYGTPDRRSGSGLFSYPSLYDAHNHQQLLDWTISGNFMLAGRRHDLAAGVSWSRSVLDDLSHYGRGIGTPMPLQTVLDGSYPMPAFDASTDGSHYLDKRQTLYAVSRFNLRDDLKWLLGWNTTHAESNGMAYGVSQNKSATRSTPYTGLVYDLTPHWSAYASYTGIFTPQNQTDISGRMLAPLLGKAGEAGIKGELLDKRLQVSAAVFSIRQDNAAEQAGMIANRTYYRGIDTLSRGVELELNGQLSSNLQLSAGYTWMQLENPDGSEAKTYLPRQLIRAAASYRVSAVPGLRVGAGINWQSAIWRDQGGGVVTRQSSYALVDAMLHYDLDERTSLTFNLSNLGNQKYLTSLYWSQAYYGAPRHASVTLNWRY